MKITLVSENAIQLEGGQESFTIEAANHRHYSPFHMLASALASCSYSVLASWARQAEVDASGLKLYVEWRHHAESHRVEEMTLRIDWPDLPPDRRSAALRAASLCSIHKTLTTPPHISIEVQ